MDPANVRPLQEGEVDALLEAEKEAEATKLALKRKIAQAATAGSDFQSRSLPPKLRIEPEDPEDVVSIFNSYYFFFWPFLILCDSVLDNLKESSIPFLVAFDCLHESFRTLVLHIDMNINPK